MGRNWCWQHLVKSQVLLLVVVLIAQTPAKAQECQTVGECAQAAVEAANEIRETLERLIPPGTVMAFNLSNCPPGWSTFQKAAGNVIVGKSDDYALGTTGGASTVTLTESELPSHTHGVGKDWGIAILRGTETGGNRFITPFSFQGIPTNQLSNEIDSKPVGGNTAFSIMQPYTVLLMCERI